MSSSVVAPSPDVVATTTTSTTTTTTTANNNNVPIVSHPETPPSADWNPFLKLVPEQTIAVVDHFDLETGVRMNNVEVAYKTWGKLNEKKDNVMIICHALTGSADVEDWWGPMLGPGLAFDPSRYFIFCANVLGSPYGTSSPLSFNQESGKRWGPEFPRTTVRDCVRLHKIILDHLGVSSVAVVIGGSMGGMITLEWPLMTPPGYIRHLIPIATSMHHSAWGISWGEGQRQSIYADPKYEDGLYSLDDPPQQGLAAARMAALLTYRSRDSFESRFGRKEQVYKSERNNSPSSFPSTPAERALVAHNEGNRNTKIYDRASSDGELRKENGDATTPITTTTINNNNNIVNGSSSSCVSTNGGSPPPHSSCSSSSSNNTQPSSSQSVLPGAPSTANESLIFAAQSYLRYQGNKFVSRFDPNCYISMTRQMDTHSIMRGRPAEPHPLNLIPANALVIAISTDGLFTLSEQQEITDGIPGARLVVIDSPEGHDGFLLEFKIMNQVIVEHLQKHLGEIYQGPPINPQALQNDSDFKVTKTSVFGEAEADITAW